MYDLWHDLWFMILPKSRHTGFICLTTRVGDFCLQGQHEYAHWLRMEKNMYMGSYLLLVVLRFFTCLAIYFINMATCGWYSLQTTHPITFQITHLDPVSVVAICILFIHQQLLQYMWKRSMINMKREFTKSPNQKNNNKFFITKFHPSFWTKSTPEKNRKAPVFSPKRCQKKTKIPPIIPTPSRLPWRKRWIQLLRMSRKAPRFGFMVKLKIHQNSEVLKICFFPIGFPKMVYIPY